VLFVGMLSGTYSSICIATPVLADLKEREPQYRALAKRVQLRASGGRAAKRAAAKSPASPAAPTRAGRAAVAAPDPDLAADDAEADVTDRAGGDATEDTGAAAQSGEPVAAGAGQPASRSGPRPGPRQQPRRTSAAKRRPSGKKRRRQPPWPATERPRPPGRAGLITSRVRDVPDYPKPGIVFKDITPLLADGPALKTVVSALASGYGPVDKVVGIEARGFILAASAACQLGAGFVPVRKQGR